MKRIVKAKQRVWRCALWAGVLAVLDTLVVVPCAMGAASGGQTIDHGAAHGDCPWVGSSAPIAARVAQLMSRMSLADKISLVHGVAAPEPYAGRVAGNPALCIPELTLHDGPLGVRMDGTTQLPSATDLAATFDPALAREYGQVIGAEDKVKGVDVDLGPTLNIVRDPRWGRAFESYSEDPYLSGQIAAGDVEGVQAQGVMAQMKHWAVYNQEDHRNTPADNVIVSDRAVHEIYTPGFAAVIKQAMPASVMCSYAWINGVNACGDPYLDGILRKQLGFAGFITSDWGGTHSTVAAANGGLDMEMPDSKYFGAALVAAIKAGKVPQRRLDTMVRRILTQEFRFGLFDRTSRGDPAAEAATPEHLQVALKVAEQGTVLLRNKGGVLPLDGKKIHSVAVIGEGAAFDTLTHGGGSASVPGIGVVTPLEGIRQRAAKAGMKVRYAPGVIPESGAYPTISAQYFTTPDHRARGLRVEYFADADFRGQPVAIRTAQDASAVWHGAPVSGVTAGHAFSVRWKGVLTPPVSGRYTFGLTSHGISRLIVDGKPVIDAHTAADAPLTQHVAEQKIISGLPVPIGVTHTASVQLVAGKPVTVEIDYVFRPSAKKAQWWMSMGTRHLSDAFVNLGWLLPGEHATIAAAAQLAARSDVAIVYANKFESEAFDNSDIDLPAGQNQLIKAVAAANPRTIVVLNTGSAVTMPWLNQVAGVVEAWYPGQQAGSAIAALLYGDVNPSGKLPITFPRSLSQVPASTVAEWGGVNGKVRYAEDLDVGYRWYDARKLTPLFPFGYGLSYTTFAFRHLVVTPAQIGAAGTVTATVEVTNTGHRPGAEVAQLYLGAPPAAGEPPRQLKAFARVWLRPGETRRVSFKLPVHDFAAWNTAKHAWQVIGGDYRIMVGDSSANLPVETSLHVAGADVAH
ncbi:MAG: glycoside hydrolase family 3 protein [Rhodanobacteraceae bacterium]